MKLLFIFIGTVIGAVIGWNFQLIRGKGKFIGVNFEENTVVFRYKFWKLGEIADNALKKISDAVTEDNAGLDKCDVIVNDGEVIISLTYSEEKLREMEKKDPEHFTHGFGETPLSFDLEAQEPLLSSICKNCL